MTRRRAAFVLAMAATFAANVAWAQTALSERPRVQADNAPVVLDVGCGALNQALCAKVLPRIAGRTAATGVTLRPLGPDGAFAAATEVCQGRMGAAIVQRDAINPLAGTTDCVGKYDVVGRPLFPYYAVLVTRADSPFRGLDAVAREQRPVTIAAGPAGGGGQVTLGSLLRADPGLERLVKVTQDGAGVALGQLAAGSIDGYFAVEALDTDLFDRLRLRVDNRGKPLLVLADIRPGAALFRASDGRGSCLYRPVALDFGTGAPVTSISVDAIMILGASYRSAHARGGPRAPDALASAIAHGQAAIAADMKAPREWKPFGTVCR